MSPVTIGTKHPERVNDFIAGIRKELTNMGYICTCCTGYEEDKRVNCKYIRERSYPLPCMELDTILEEVQGVLQTLAERR